jgi:hypothetical protein
MMNILHSTSTTTCTSTAILFGNAPFPQNLSQVFGYCVFNVEQKSNNFSLANTTYNKMTGERFFIIQTIVISLP